MTTFPQMVVINIAVWSAMVSLLCLWVAFECRPGKPLRYYGQKWYKRSEDTKNGIGFLVRWFALFFAIIATVFYFWASRF